MTIETWFDFAVVILIVINVTAYVVLKISGKDLEAMDKLLLAILLTVSISL